MHLSLKGTLATLALAALAPTAAHAQVTITFLQAGSDVDAQATGKLNLTGLTFQASDIAPSFVYGSLAGVLVGSNSTFYDIYSGFTGPAAFGTGGQIFASSGSGDRFAIVGGIFDQLAVPTGYTSESSISGSAVFTGQTFTSLGLSPGSYTYELPNDTVTVNIGAPAAVPEPSPALTFAVATLGLGGLMAAARKRRRA